VTDNNNEVKPFFPFFSSSSSLKRTYAYNYRFEFPSEYTLELCRAEAGLPVVVQQATGFSLGFCSEGDWVPFSAMSWA